jgi:hypothetical protein
VGGCGSSSPPGTAHPAAPHDQIWRRWRGGRLAAGCGSTARPGAVLQHPLAGQRPWLAATGAALALGDASLPASRQAELSPCRPTAHTRLPAWLPTLAAPPACPVLPALCCLRCLPCAACLTAFLILFPCSCLSSIWRAQRGRSTLSLPPACPPACPRYLQWRATWPRCQVGTLS